ncbi:MAG: hypothetical protein ACQERI_08655, partial [Candidatus Krumholzibacteriota bacterium]
MKGLVILGPTAAGKSGLALEISQEYRGEIVCIDSRTVYRKIDIGTAKPTPDQRETVPHHMLDLLDLDQKCDAVWLAGARSPLEETTKRSGSASHVDLMGRKRNIHCQSHLHTSHLTTGVVRNTANSGLERARGQNSCSILYQG